MLNSITSFLNQRTFIEVVIPWLQKLCISYDHIQESLYSLTIHSLSDAVFNVVRDKSASSDPEEVKKLDHIYNTLTQKMHMTMS